LGSYLADVNENGAITERSLKTLKYRERKLKGFGGKGRICELQ